MNTQEKIGERFIFAKALLWSFFPIITSVLVSTFSPIFALGLSMLIASGFFALVITIQGKWHELNSRAPWKEILIATFLIGILFYGLFFSGLQFTSAGNASIIALMEAFFTIFLLGAITKKDSITPQIIFGALLMVVGAFLVIFKNSFIPNKGDILILCATAIPPFGNYYMKRIREHIGSNASLFIRSFISAIFLLILSFVFDSFSTQISMFHFVLFIVNGVLLLGVSKIFFIEAIHRMPISKTISLLSIAPAFTLLFVYLLFDTTPNMFQIIGLLPISIGVFVLTRQKNPA